MKKVLCVVTSNNVKGDSGISTGFWLSELTHPMVKLEEAGIKTERQILYLFCWKANSLSMVQNTKLPQIGATM